MGRPRSESTTPSGSFWQQGALLNTVAQALHLPGLLVSWIHCQEQPLGSLTSTLVFYSPTQNILLLCALLSQIVKSQIVAVILKRS